MRQGQVCPEITVVKIIRLLRETELSLTDIAKRMKCSRSLVASINRRSSIRSYSGRRRHWSLVAEAFVK
jgi:hypothetical protein